MFLQHGQVRFSFCACGDYALSGSAGASFLVAPCAQAEKAPLGYPIWAICIPSCVYFKAQARRSRRLIMHRSFAGDLPECRMAQQMHAGACALHARANAGTPKVSKRTLGAPMLPETGTAPPLFSDMEANRTSRPAGAGPRQSPIGPPSCTGRFSDVQFEGAN